MNIDTATADQLRALAQRLDAEADQRDRQLGTADLAGMTPADVEAARERGQFSRLLAGDDPNRKDA